MISIAVVSADTFSGTGSATTGTFESAVYTKIEWTYVPFGSGYNSFEADVMKEGETSPTTDFDDATNGTTYLYDSGTFYFEVLVDNVASWTINTTPTDGDWASSGTTFTGQGNRNTKLFKSYGNTKITWTIITENPYDIFNVDIMKVGESSRTSNFYGVNGTTYLYQSGDFYFDVTATNIVSWTITIDTNSTTPTTSSAASSTTPTTSSAASSTTPTYGLLVLGTIVSILTLALFSMKRQRRN